MKSVGILGVSGVLAQAVLAELEADPEVGRIVGIDVHPPQRHPGKLEFHPADLRQAPLGALLRGVDTVVHLALPGAVEEAASRGGRGDAVLSIRRAAEAAREVGARRLVVATSITVYGAHPDNPVPLQEWHPLRPQDDAPITKGWAEVEQALDALEAAPGGLALVRLRTAPVVGPSLREGRARLAALNRIFLSKTHDAKLLLLHEADFAQAVRRVLFEGRPGVYHVAAGEPLSPSDLYAAAGASVVQLPSLAVRCLTRWAAYFQPSLVPPEILLLARHAILVSTQPIRQEYGWNPRFNTLEAFLDARRSADRSG